MSDPVVYDLVWDQVGEKYYETGTDRGVLFPMGSSGYEAGVAWNGLTGVTDSPSGGDRTELWADNIMYGSVTAREKAGGSIKAYTYPDEFNACNGQVELVDGLRIGQQARKKFGFCYRTLVGNDVSEEAGYIIHIYYGCSASPSSRDYATVNDSPNAIEFSWDFDATAVPVTGARPTASLEIDSRTADATKLAALEVILYGTPAAGQTAAVPARLPLPDEIKSTLS